MKTEIFSLAFFMAFIFGLGEKKTQLPYFNGEVICVASGDGHCSIMSHMRWLPANAAQLDHARESGQLRYIQSDGTLEAPLPDDAPTHDKKD